MKRNPLTEEEQAMANLLTMDATKQAVPKGEEIKLVRSETAINDAALIGTVITKQLIIDELWEVYQMCKAVKPVLDRQGTPTGYLEFESRSAIKCLELLGKEMGMFKNDQLPDPYDRTKPEEEEVQALATHLTNLIVKSSERTRVIDIEATKSEDEGGSV